MSPTAFSARTSCRFAPFSDVRSLSGSRALPIVRDDSGGGLWSSTVTMSSQPVRTMRESTLNANDPEGYPSRHRLSGLVLHVSQFTSRGPPTSVRPSRSRTSNMTNGSAPPLPLFTLGRLRICSGRRWSTVGTVGGRTMGGAMAAAAA